MIQSTLRGILLMTIAMALFAAQDTATKLASSELSAEQILLMVGFGGAVVFALWGAARGMPVVTRAALHPALLARNALEMLGSFCSVTALTLVPLSVASAILQAAPILVTAGAALFLGEAVGWRRWAAVGVGFGGVLVILRPGGQEFDPNTLWAVVGVVALAARDLATRRLPPGLPTTTVAAWGFGAVGVMGLGVMGVRGEAVWPSSAVLGLLAGAIAFGLVAYWCVIEATRHGDVSAVAPFRYTRLVFALLLGIAVFDERPDALMLLGAAIVVASGVYTYLREARIKRLSNRAHPR